MLFVISHLLSTKVSPEWRLNPGFGDPEKVSLSPEWRCPLNRGYKYTDYVNIQGAKKVSFIACHLGKL